METLVIRVARSPVHGRGVFATRRIYPGTIAERAPALRADLPRYDFVGRRVVLGSTSLLNHSEDSNCEVEFRGDVALLRVTRRIERGEELLLDYGPAAP